MTRHDLCCCLNLAMDCTAQVHAARSRDPRTRHNALSALEATNRELTGRLDDMARMAHPRSTQARIGRHLELVVNSDVKGLAAELRPPLRDPQRIDELRAIIACESASRLRSPGLRGELGAGPHGVLMAHLSATETKGQVAA